MTLEKQTRSGTIVDVRRLQGLTPYADAWDLQKDLVRLRKNDGIPDTFVVRAHPPVYTVGRAAKDAGNLGAGEEYLRALGAEVFWSDRGGDVTFHGPGQIVGYPILRLEGRHHPVYTGVWIGESKVAAIGVKFSSGWITSHGFALNVKTDLSWFDRITPCGIKEFGVTSLTQELGREVSLGDVEERIVDRFLQVFR